MLDKSLIAKLQQVKDTIEASKERAQGTIKSTNGRFGFVMLTDKREIYLSAQEMEKVLPGDIVNIIVHTAADGKTSAEIETLHSTSLKFIIGQYQIRGQGHFVAPDPADNLRWIFIPPKTRGNAKPGDYILCELIQHPYPTGKAQAGIIRNMGNADRPGIETDYAIARFQLITDDLTDGLIEPDLSTREDFSALSLLTIDAADAPDMDDALFAETTNDGWRLVVAIADASAHVAENSPLEQLARKRATSTYLPGKTLNMLPEKIAANSGSLMPGQLRAALLCEMSIAKTGEILAHEFKLGCVRSHAKLSYPAVSAHFEKNTPIDYPDVLGALCDASCALANWREKHLLTSTDRPDYRLLLNPQGKISDCILQEKSLANRLVEECMIATNRCATEFLNGIDALYVQHPGFRTERLGDAKALCRENLVDVEADPAILPGYVTLMRAAQAVTNSAWPVATILSRWLSRATLSRKPAVHMGMGLAAYLTMTSPLRKYSDFFCHRLIKAKLLNQPLPQLTDSELAEIIQGLENSRQARNLVEQWLKAQYLTQKIGAPYLGKITNINSNGLSVKIIDNGIDGHIDIKSLQQKYKFDARHLALVSDHKVLKLDDQVMIRVEAVQMDQRVIQFKLNEG